MKKHDYSRFLRVQKRKLRKALTRKRKNRQYKDNYKTFTKIKEFQQKHDIKVIENTDNQLNTFLENTIDAFNGIITQEIPVPEIFSMEKDYDATIRYIDLIRKSMNRNLGKKIVIDFTNCTDVDFSSLFFLKVIMDEYIDFYRKLDNKLLTTITKPEIEIIHSTNQEVNLKLLANQLIPIAKASSAKFIPISSLNLIKGSKSQKHYTENRKGIAATQIRNYFNTGLIRRGFCLYDKSVSSLDGIISEILNNAEDHSPFNTWYAFANLFETNKVGSNTNIVGELNLAFLNFGYSIYEGFEESKIQNSVVYDQMDRMYDYIHNKKDGKDFTKENLFTLYALQEGISRLKFETESRGTGTMKFINSFLEIGDYEDKNNDYIPYLLIYSGNTILKCSNKYRPFLIDRVNYLSLNINKTLSEPPDNSHLGSLNFKFPGTLLLVKVYLNGNHLKEKLEKNGTKDF